MTAWIDIITSYYLETQRLIYKLGHYHLLKITMVCLGGMRRYLPDPVMKDGISLELPDVADVAQALKAVGASPCDVFSVLVDGRRAQLGTSLHDGAEVVLMPPFSGGAPFRAAVVTVSDAVAAGERKDGSGQAVVQLLRDAGYHVEVHEVVPDRSEEIEACLRRLVVRGVSLVCTTGGTGLGPRDVTPEATKRVVERDAPGLAELARHAGLKETKHAALSRGVAGTRAGSLIINLPGSPRGATTSLLALLDVLEHALDLVAGKTTHLPSPMAPN